MMSRMIAAVAPVVFATATAAGALFGAAAASADPTIFCPSDMMYFNPGFCNPHLPDPVHDHCLGGRAGSLMSEGYCDGEPYPDGSFWRATQHGASTVEHPGGWMALDRECVVHDGAGTRPAPPGGCGLG